MDGFFKRLTQQELAALGRSDVAVGAQHNIVGGQRVGGHKKAEVALDDAALVFGQAIGVFPQGDVAGHVDLLRHPVVGASGQVFFPGPFVLERHQLVDIGLAIDDAFVLSPHTLEGTAAFCAASATKLAAAATVCKLASEVRGDDTAALRVAEKSATGVFCKFVGREGLTSSSQVNINDSNQRIMRAVK